MAQLQENINGIIAAFYVCARSDSSCRPLNREKLRQLFEQELGDTTENPQDPQAVKKVMCFLDNDSNCRVDFSELLSLVFRVAKAYYKPLQQHQAPEDGQEVTAQEKASGEQPLEPCTAHRNWQVPEQGVGNHVEDTETQDPDNHQTQEGEMSKQDQDTHETQEGETPEQDHGTQQTQEAEPPEQDYDTHQGQEGETSKQDHDTHQAQESETSKQDHDTHQAQESEISKQDQATHQTEEGETPEQDKDTQPDDGTGAPERDPERSEILDTSTPEQDRNTYKAEDTETPNQDPKIHQAQETEAPAQSSNHSQSPKTESAEQDPAYHQHPEPKVLGQEHSGVGDPSCPAQQQHNAHQQKQPAIEQQLLESLYQWPPEQ
ncbi:repetin-like [Strigops habroptila]|uniref:repetin-like n=1 Tax=Strigops habroptila TaxID=2489341 RepID=UPI0011CF4FED|nr:repetin-like [Strigops habroptila]